VALSPASQYVKNEKPRRSHFVLPYSCAFALDRLWWVLSLRARRLLVVTGARCPLTKPVVGCCCWTPGDHRAPTQPGRAARRYLRARRYSASRLSEARGRACAGAAGASYSVVTLFPRRM
jgi:hypothetical protein